jgi:hypothetical protein
MQATSFTQIVRDQCLKGGVGVRTFFFESALDEIRAAAGFNGNIRQTHYPENPLPV